ncbi:hypothetical protein MYX78_10320 [Acidobacteria bacterium AH-259-G07]|nr:hypothetical protein [Acidobacteria bacterium AH-259-G07]
MCKFIRICVFSLCGLSVYASDVSLFAGWTDVNSARSVTGEVKLNNFNVFGARFEKDFFVILGFENTLAVSANSVLTTAGEDDGGLYYTSNLVVNLPIRRMLTFFTWGLGVSHKFGDSFPDVGSRFATNFGTGVKLRRLAGPIGLRMDYRRFTIHSVLDENVNTNEVSVGIIFTY